MMLKAYPSFLTILLLCALTRPYYASAQGVEPTPSGGLTIGSYCCSTAAPTNGLIVSGEVGIGNSSPGALLDVGLAGTTLGVMRLEGSTSGYTALSASAAAGSWTMTLPTSGGTSGYVLQTDGTGITSWVAQGSGSAINLGNSATATNPSRSTTTNTGFYSAAVSTVAVASSGIEAMQWNTLTSGVDYLSVTPGKSGTAPKLAVAGGTTNQSLGILPTGTGGVGIGTASPIGALQVYGGAVTLSGSSANLAGASPPNTLENTGDLYIAWNESNAGGETDFFANRGTGGIGGYYFYDYSNAGVATSLMTLLGNGNLAVTGNITQSPALASSTSNYLDTNAGGNYSSTSLAPGLLVLNVGYETGMDVGYSSSSGRYRGRVFTHNGGDISFATHPAGTSPTSQSSFTDLMVIRGDTGNVGIGTASPNATLDVTGYMRLATNSSQPVACSSTNDGAIALTAVYTLCICKGGSTTWVQSKDGSTACTW